MVIRNLVIFAFVLFYFNSLKSQTSIPDTLKAARVAEPIHIDGDLKKGVWQSAFPITNFTQREPSEGGQPTEQTKVAVLYDTHNIYFGVWCFDSEPGRISAKEMSRDFNWSGDDDIEIMISPFNDNRNGYLFITNPNGAMADVWLGGDGGRFNKDWNGVWDVRVTRDQNGWYAEFAIPFSTLKFKRDSVQKWSVNFERNIRRKNEQVRWQGWSRSYSIDNISQSGKLEGIRDIKQKDRVEITPYITTGKEREYGFTNSAFKIGGEINYDISPTMKLNFTLNTDFAQVESDRREVNLSRFSIYYPEKRQFFLEGSSYFDMSVSSARLFYSRRIGIEEESVIPIIGGGRLFGKIGKTSIGIMNLQTAALKGISSSNSSIIRIKQDIFEESGIGFISTQKFSNGKYSATYGTDFTYKTSKFLGDKNLMAGFSGAITLDNPGQESAKNKDNATYHFFLFYPNDIWSFNAGINTIQENFNPTLGFVNRSNFKRIYSELEFEPRFKKMPSYIRSFSFQLYDLEYFINDKTGFAETFSLDVRPFGINFSSGDYFGLNYEFTQDNPHEDFPLIDGVVIPKGQYNDNNFSAEFHSFDGRNLNAGVEFEAGSFYTGKRSNIEMYLNLSLNRHLSLGLDWSHNTLDLPQGDFKVNEFGGRVNYALNPKLNSSLFAQWNNEDDEVILNYRINWIPKIGSFFYFVVNQNIDTANNTLKLTRTTILAKLIWRFAL
ncbi:MAG TPA: hypothetical protein DEO54_01880 [Rikenellaceae bacterium]|nr:hypothetical protein [Rikenellaceae bacterium]